MRRGYGKGELLQPICRWELIGDGDVLLMDTKALALHLGIGDRTVRHYKRFWVKKDEQTGAPLYDALKIGADRKRIEDRAGKRRLVA